MKENMHTVYKTARDSRGLPAPGLTASDLPARCAQAGAQVGAQAGLTIIEALVSIAIFTFAIIAIVTSVQYFYRTNTYTIQQASAVSSAQRGVDSLVKTIREATYSSNGAYPIVAIGANEITFYADIDTDIFIERVRYYVENTSLYRDVTDPSGDPLTYGASQTTSIVSETVRNLDQSVTTFRYYEESGAEILDYAEIADVRFIEMNIVVNVDPNRLPNQLTLHSTAAIRNLK
jgi:type II secretory pathway pseudopilin PulG